MNTIEKMIEQREKLRIAEAELTKQIKTERKLLQDKKKQEKTSSNSDCELKKLQNENSKLKGLIAIILREKGITYNKIAEEMGLSESRVRYIVGQQIRSIRWHDYHERKDEDYEDL